MIIDITKYLPSKRKTSPSGWISFNAVCCHHRGERQDKRGRGGMLIDGDKWTFHCFNCGFTASYDPAEHLRKNTKLLLTWLNVEQELINKLGLLSIKNKAAPRGQASKKSISVPKFESINLPAAAELLSVDNSRHTKYLDYLSSRGVKLQDKYYVTPDAEDRNQNRIIIPFTYNNNLVGYTSRFIDDLQPKYINHYPPGYVFGLDHQSKDWKYLLVVEGVFDALLTRGVAVMHNTISDCQAHQIRMTNKEIIVVPDRDKAGEGLIDRAIELGWMVSFPNWDNDIKDAADAVQRYGRLTTLISIVESVERSKLKIELRRKLHA